MKKRFVFIVLYAIVFATGTAGLIYQVSWHKYLSRLLGSDGIATAIILAVFLGGLSVGYFFCGKFTLHVKNHLKIYGILEGVIGLWCLFFPSIFTAINSVTRSWSFSPPFLIILQGGMCSILLMGIPTVCMGGTLPFLTRGLSRTVTEAASVHAKVYSINTAGAFVGTLLAGFYLIPSYGLPVTMMGTAFLNLGACMFFYGFSAVIESTTTAPALEETDGMTQQQQDPRSPQFPVSILYLVAFLSGLYVMTLENVFIRFTNLSLGSSSYSFSLIVAVFILCIAIGSYVVSRYTNISHYALFINQSLITVTLLLLYLSLDSWPYWAHILRISCQANIAGFWLYYAVVFFALTVVCLLPLSCMGATVPLIFHELKRNLQQVGKHSGILLSWNTGGNLIGSLLGGIVLYYFFNNANIYLIAVFMAALSTCLVGWHVSKRSFFFILLPLTIIIGVSVLSPPFYREQHFMTGTFRARTPSSYSFSGPERFFKRYNEGNELKFYKDGPMSTVAVIASPKDPTFQKEALAIFINGKSDSSTIGDIYTLKLLAHLPALLAGSRKQVMVIGLGTGVTAGELTLYPDIERIDVAEISPFVVKALPYFHDFIYDLERDSRVSIQQGDAFRLLGRSSEKWDLVISEPTNPWTTGVDLLFTQEFYKLVKEHLSEEGMVVQWVHRYSSNPQIFGTILHTIRQEFQYVRVFMANSGDLLILGSKQNISRSHILNAEETLQQNAQLRASLESIDLASLQALLLRELWTPSGIDDHFRHFGLQTMDDPILHYMAGKAFFLGENVPLDYLFNSQSAFYVDEFLLVAHYQDWAAFPSSKAVFERLIASTKQKGAGHFLPMVSSLKFKAHLHDPEAYPLIDSEKDIFGVDFALLSRGTSQGEQAWGKLGLQGASFRQKASALIQHLTPHRNWIAFYPLHGLKDLLRNGMGHGEDAYEKNWCALQLVRILLLEKADKQSIDEILSQLIRDENQKILLAEGREDQALLSSVYQRINN